MPFTCKVRNCDVILLTRMSLMMGKCFYHQNKTMIDTLRTIESANVKKALTKNMTPIEHELFIKENLPRL